jgi:hypothetical protein
MIHGGKMRARQTGQEGYALVLVVFLLALVVIATTAVVPDILVNGRREKEEEMIWRGKQYVRGIRLFVRYQQMHGGATRFPTSLEDLTKNKVGIRFMRREYKDPMNNKDGTWRFIYVGPNGQLIGSLKQRPLGGSTSAFGSLFGNSTQGTPGNAPAAGNSSSNSSFGNSSFGTSSFGNSSTGNSASSFGTTTFSSGSTAAAIPGATSTADAGGATADAQNTDSMGQMSTPQAMAADLPSDLIGGNIIGVGGKINQKSIIWYEKAKNYRQFEFVWDPSKEPINGGANAGIIGMPTQAPANGTNSIFSSPAGQSGFGQPMGGANSGFGGNAGTGQTGGGTPPPGTPPQ